MTSMKTVSRLSLLICILLLSSFGYAHSSMKVTTKSGMSISVPVSKDDLVSITFDDQASADATEMSTETLVVPNDKPLKVNSKIPLAKGRWYIIEASGVFNDWGNAPDGIDAIWCYAEWRCGKNGEVWNQLRIDGKGMTDIAGKQIPYNPEHVYRIRYKGEGKPVELYMIDAQGSSSDNVGSLTVSITPE